MVDHQRINGTSFVFSVAVPALLAVSASEGINYQHPPEHTFYLEYAAGECVRDPRGARPYRLAHDPPARSLTDHPHPPMYRDAVAICHGSEGSEPRSRGFAGCTVVRYFGRGAPLVGHRRRGAHAGRVDHKGSVTA